MPGSYEASPETAPATLADLFHRFAGLDQEYLVYHNGYRPWTYTCRQVADAARAFAVRLAAAGIGKGDRVVIWSESRPEWVAAFWGCVLDGVQVAPLDARVSRAFAGEVQAAVGARIVLVGDETAGADFGSIPAWRLPEIAGQAAGTVAATTLDPDDVAEIVFASDVTPLPLTHRDILAGLTDPGAILSRFRRCCRPLRVLSLVPSSNLFGQAVAMFLLPSIPGAAMFMRSRSPDEIARQIRRNRVTAVIADPGTLELLRTHVVRRFPEAQRPGASNALARWFGPRFQGFVAAGAPVSPDLEEFWQKLRLPVVQGTGPANRAEVDLPALDPRATVVAILREYAPGREFTDETTLEELGLRSLERVQILVELECRLGIGIAETVLAGPSRVSDLVLAAVPPSPAPFPTWSRQWWARAIRKATLSPILLPLTRCFVRLAVSGHEHLQDLPGQVIFAPNHQSHLDTLAFLAALPARWRHRTAAAAWKEYFDAHFYPAGHSFRDRLATSLAYYLVALLVNGFPLPQTEASTADSLRYIGDLVSEGWSILFYPEGGRADTPELMKFEPGIGLLASRLAIPVVPVRLRGVNEVLDRYARFPTPGPVTIAFGPPLRLRGDNFEELAAQVKEAVARL